jgi:bud site selection protein 31
MRDAENETHEGKRKTESLWPIMRISHTRSRYIYELYYKREAISKELYDWLLKEGYADAKCVIFPHIVFATRSDIAKFDCQVEESGL